MKSKLFNTGKALLLPVILCAVFGLLAGERFLDAKVFSAICNQTVYTTLLSFAMAMTMELGMWNFALGAIIYLSSMVGAHAAETLGLGPVGLVVFPILISVVCCAVLALLYRQIKMPLMIVALGGALVVESICRIIYNGRGASIGFKDGIFAKAPYCYILLVIGFVIFYFLYNLTSFGQDLHAVGSSQEISYSAGLDIQKIKTKAIIWGGVFAGFASIVFLSNNIKIVAPSNEFGSVGLIFEAMMGFYVASFLRKYCEFTTGILIGCFSMKILQCGMMTCGLSSNVRSIFIGAFVLSVLIFSSNQGRYGAWLAKKKLAELLNKEYETCK